MFQKLIYLTIKIVKYNKNMKKLIKIFLFLIFTLTFLSVYSFDITTLWTIDSSVIDKVGVLKQEEKQSLETKIQELRTKYTTEILLVIIPTTDGEDISSVGTEIWQKIWVGKADKDNWVVILIAIDDRAWNISTWYWVEGVLPDLLTNRIWEKNFVLFKESRYFDWIMGTLTDFWKAFEWDPSIISLQKENTETPVLWIFEVILIFFFSYVFLRPLVEKKKYNKFWTYFFIAFFVTLPITYFSLFEVISTFFVNFVIWLIFWLFWIFWKSWYNWSSWWRWKSGSWGGGFWGFGWWSFGGWWSSWKW